MDRYGADSITTNLANLHLNQEKEEAQELATLTLGLELISTNDEERDIIQPDLDDNNSNLDECMELSESDEDNLEEDNLDEDNMDERVHVARRSSLFARFASEYVSKRRMAYL